MRILIVTPRQPEETGNLVTARRHQDSLSQRGHEVCVTLADEKDPATLRQAVQFFRPDLVHLLHAWRSGQPWLNAAVDPGLPYVVTLTGTDIHGGISTPGEKAVIRAVLEGAAAVICQNRITAEVLSQKSTPWAKRVRYLPPGIVLGSTPYPLRRLHSLASDTLLFLHPAGIRPVKANLELLQLFDRVAAARPGVQIAFCGPVLDHAYARRFLAEVGQRPWAHYLAVIPTAAMPAALRETDIILNHSLSEGLPNALIEAAALGRPILARDIPGNAAVVDTGGNGLLYRSDDEFIQQALALIDDPLWRRKLSLPHPEKYDPALEAKALETIYQEALQSAASDFCA